MTWVCDGALICLPQSLQDRWSVIYIKKDPVIYCFPEVLIYKRVTKSECKVSYLGRFYAVSILYCRGFYKNCC